MEILPDELWLAIFGRLGLFTLARIGRTSSAFYRLSSDPSLWSRVQLDSTLLLPGLSHILERSQTLPLDIDIWPGDQMSVASIQVYHILRNTLARVRRLTLRGAAHMFSFDREEGTDPLECLLTTPAPILEAFSIDSKQASSLIELPRRLFGGRHGASLLRQVSLDRCVVDLSMPVLRNGRVESLILGAGCHLVQDRTDTLESVSLKTLGFSIRPDWAAVGLPLVTNLTALENVKIQVREGPCTAVWSRIHAALQTKGYLMLSSVRVDIIMRSIEEALELTLEETRSGDGAADRRGRVYFAAAHRLNRAEICKTPLESPVCRTSAPDVVT